MKFNQLKITASKNPRRVGRGISAGQGKTAGRGTKGQNSRAGGGVRPGFEGGQNPLMQRLPKLRGFTSFKPKTDVIYTAQLNELGASLVDNSVLAKAGLTDSPHTKVKLILGGEVKKKIKVQLQNASQGAQKAIAKAGGSFVAVPQLKRLSPKETTKPLTKAKR